MAELNDRAASAEHSQPHTIPAAVQFRAIAWMRWRMFANSFRRQKGRGEVAGLVFRVVLRIILWPFLALWVIGPAVASGFLAWKAASSHHEGEMVVLLAGVFLLWQFVAINAASMAAAISNFDPASLLRFPLPFGRYLVLRLMLGLLTPSTIVGCFTLLAAAIGVAVADRSLGLVAAVVLAVYAAMNIFFSRMAAAWLERWLSSRRGREIFGTLMAIFAVGIQVINFRHIGTHGHATRSWLMTFLETPHPRMGWLPFSFAGKAILLAGHPLARCAQFAGLLAWSALFLAVFAIRLHRQFLGEYLTEGPPRAAAGRRQTSTQPKVSSPTTQRPSVSFLPQTISACLRKEWLSLQGVQLISMLTPLVFVFIFARGILGHHPAYLLSGSAGYVLLGSLAAQYNIFGADGAGVQLYLLAPIRMRDVILAKNLASLTVLLPQVLLAWAIVWVSAGSSIPPPALVSAVFWVVFVIFTNLAFGALRSIQAPIRVLTPGQTRSLRPAGAGRTSGLLVLGIFLGSMLLEVPVMLLASYLGNLWLAAWVFAPLAAIAVGAYLLLLQKSDELVLSRRDVFAQELCGT